MIKLSKRQEEVLNELAETGSSNEEIAKALKISIKTVEAHLNEISLRITGDAKLSRGKLIVYWWRKKCG